MRGRQIVRKYLIHSPFKPMVKTTRYKKPQYTVRTLLKSPTIRDVTIQEVIGAIKTECELLCKRVPFPSKLRSSSVDSLTQFNIVEELREKSPILLSVLQAAASSRRTKATDPAIVMAAAVLVKSRSLNMCKLQAIVSSLLYSGHASKKVLWWIVDTGTRGSVFSANLFGSIYFGALKCVLCYIHCTYIHNIICTLYLIHTYIAT